MHFLRVITITSLIGVVFGVNKTAAQEKSLPRVLIIGDTIYQQPAGEVSKELKGKVEVVYNRPSPGEVCNSTTVLKNLDTLLGEKKWDVIHFNVGLGDLVYRAPGMKSFRVFPKNAGGIRTTSPEVYEKNLQAIATRLKKTGAKLIWASTTPIRHSRTGVFELKSEIEYNAIAAKVMKQHQISINDMYADVVKVIDMDKPAGHGADPFSTDKKPIHAPIVAAILNGLK